LGVFPVGPAAFTFDDDKIIFADDHVAHVTAHQAGELATAAGVDLHTAVANLALKKAGVTGEHGVGVARGIEPSTTRRSVAGVASDLALGDGLGFDSKTSEGRLLVVSNCNVRLFRGGRISKMGQMLGVYGVGADVLVREDDVLGFPDGEVIKLPSADAAMRVASIARLGRLDSE
jgi:hypothetical protein